MHQSNPMQDDRVAPMAMRYRTLGKTQLEVSVVGFGASPLGNVYEKVDPAESGRAVHFAIDHGINFFDVSPYYGLTLAEERLGQALDGRRKEVILATKCGRYGVDVFDFSAEHIREGLHASLKRLRTDHVDLLQVHDVEFGDVDQIIHETIPTMRRLQQEGKTRYIGITGYPLQVLVKIMEAVPVDTVLSYCRYDLLCDDLDTILAPSAEQQGIGVINASGLHMGVLTDRGAPEWHPAPTAVRDAGRQAAEFCRSQGEDLSELALQFCFQYPRVASTLVGMSDVEEVRRNLQAFYASPNPDILREVRTMLAPIFNYRWSSGLEENQDVFLEGSPRR